MPPPGRGEWVSLVLLLLLHVFLLSVNIGTIPFSTDELAYAFRFATPWRDYLEWIAGDNHPPLFLVCLRAWTELVGVSEWTLRVHNLLFAPATLAVCWWGSRRLAGPRTALIYTAVMAFNPLWFFVCRIGKYYSLLACLAAVLVWILLVVLHERRHRLSLGQGACWLAAAVLMPWVHYLGLVFMGLLGAILMWAWRRWRIGSAPGLLALLVIGGVCYLPWLPTLLARVSEEPAPGFDFRSLLIRSIYTCYAMAIGFTIEASHLMLVGAGLLGAGVFLVAGFRIILRQDPIRRVIALVPATMLPVCIAVFMLFLPGFPDLAVPERISFLLPPIVYTGVAGACALRGSIRTLALLFYTPAVAYSLFSAATWRENNSWDYQIPWRAIAEPIEKRAPDSPAVVSVSGHFDAGAWYYLRPRAVGYQRYAPALGTPSAREIALRLREEHGTIFLLIGTRDTPDDAGSRAMEEFVEVLGEPEHVHEFVEDSQSMLRLKRLLRSGSGEETKSAKINLLEFRGRPSALSDTH